MKKLFPILFSLFALVSHSQTLPVDSRLAAKAIRNLPGLELSMAQLRLQNLPSASFSSTIQIIDKRREGTFIYDPSDVTTADNGGTVLVDAKARRYKRQYKGMVEVEWFGAEGSSFATTGTSSQQTNQNAAAARKNTQAIQDACDWAAYSAGTSADQTLYPRNKERSSVVHLPAGTYLTDKAVELHGAVKIIGDEGMSFGGTAIVSWDAPSLGIMAHHLFVIKGAPETGVSAATVIEKMRLLAFNTSGNPYAAIYSGDEVGSSYNSLYFRDVWFQSGSSGWLAAWIKKGDDIKFTGCTFDGAINTLQVLLGDNAKPDSRVLNAEINDCTIYDNRGGVVDALNVDGLMFVNNRVYGSQTNRTPYVIYTRDASFARGIQINDNKFWYVNGIYDGKHSAIITGNQAYECNNTLVRFTGGGGTIIRDALVKNNQFFGSWPVAENAPVFAESGVALANCQFDNVIVNRSGTVNPFAYFMPIQNEVNTINPRGVVGFTTVTNNPSNGVLPASYGSMTQQNSDAVSITGGSATSLSNITSNNATFNNLSVANLNLVHDTETIAGSTTSSWSTSTSYTLVPPAALPFNTSYFLYLSLDKANVETVLSVYLITIGATSANAPAPPPIAPLSKTSMNPGSAGFVVSLLKPVANAATHGIGITFGDNNYAGATVTWRLVKAP